jgi:hypothetical protein
MNIPVCIALLVGIMLVWTPQAAVLAKEATVVQLRLHGTYEDTLPPENPFGSRLLHFKGLLDLIREATVDQNIAALYLKSESPRLGLAKVRELVQALQEFKAEGKRIYAFVEHAHLIDLLLLSVADRIAMPDAASVLLPGVSAEVLYVKDFLDKFGVKMLVTPLGTTRLPLRTSPVATCRLSSTRCSNTSWSLPTRPCRRSLPQAEASRRRAWLRRLTAPSCRLPT